jgi:voltage-gated sodium channel
MVRALQSWREQLGQWIEHPRQQMVIIAVIILNAVTLGMETIPEVTNRFGGILHLFDQIIIVIFVVEIGVKLLAYGWRFFLSAWNIFDFLIVAISLVPSASALSILRTLRVFRLLRLLNKVPRLRKIVESMLQAIPSIGWVSLMLMLVFYIFAVLGTTLYGGKFPEWFGDLGASAYTLFQVMTLESWSMGIARPVIAEFPYATFFFVPFILIATFTMLNLFIAIIVSTMQSISIDEGGDEITVNVAAVTVSSPNAELLHEVRLLSEKITNLERMLLTAQQPAEMQNGVVKVEEAKMIEG